MYVTPHHIVGEVWFQHQEFGINLELRDKEENEHYIQLTIIIKGSLNNIQNIHLAANSY